MVHKLASLPVFPHHHHPGELSRSAPASSPNVEGNEVWDSSSALTPSGSVQLFSHHQGQLYDFAQVSAGITLWISALRKCGAGPALRISFQRDPLSQLLSEAPVAIKGKVESPDLDPHLGPCEGSRDMLPLDLQRSE